MQSKQKAVLLILSLSFGFSTPLSFASADATNEVGTANPIEGGTKAEGESASGNASQTALSRGMVQQSWRQYAEARKSYDEALRQAISKIEQINALKGIGLLAMGDGREDDALDALKQASALESTLPNVDEATKAATLMNLGLAYTHLYQYGEAEPVYKKALEAAESSHDKKTISKAYDHFGMLFMKDGRFGNADEASLKAVNIAKEAWGADSVNAACMMANRGYLLGLEGRYKDSESTLNEALEIQRKRSGEDSALVASVLSDLGKVYLTQKKLSAAEEAFAEAIKIRGKLVEKNESGLLKMKTFLARTLMEEGKTAAAKQLAETSLKLAEQKFGEDSPKIFWQLLTLATVAENGGDYTKSLTLAERAYAHNKTDHKLLILLSKLYQRSDLRRSESFAREALSKCERQFGPEHPEVARCSVQLASVLRNEKQSIEAAQLDARVAGIRQRIVLLNSGK